MRSLPFITSFDDVEIRGVRGQPIFNYYKLVGKTLEQYDEDHSLIHYLARPDADAGNGEIAWSTDADGQIRKFSSLNAAEKEKFLDKVNEIRDRIRTISGSLPANDRALKEVLNAILLVTNLERCLFIVGDTPVVCEWGCNAYADEMPEQDQPQHKPSEKAAAPLPAQPAAFMHSEEEQPSLASPRAAEAQIETEEQDTTVSASQPEEAELHTATSATEDNPSQPQAPNHKKQKKVLQPDAPLTYRATRRTPQQTMGDISKYVALAIMFLQLLIILYMGWMRDHASFFSTENIQSAIAAEEIQLRADIRQLRKQAYAAGSQCPVSAETEITDVGGTQTLPQRLQLAGKDLSGSLAVVLTWNGKHDLDLYVEEPGGVTTGVGIDEQLASQTGGMIDLDMNNIRKKASMNDNPVEIVKWQRPPPPGPYTVGLRLYRVDYSYKPQQNIDFHIAVVRDGKVILDKSSNVALSLDCKNKNNQCATITVAEFEVPK